MIGTPENVEEQNSQFIIRGAFSLFSVAATETASISHSGIIQTAYAFGCGGHAIVNPIDKSTVRVSCNKKFKYENDDVLANSNFQELLDIYIYDFDQGGWEITFDSTFISKVEFEKEDYTFSIRSRTNGGISFTNEVTLEMDL